MKQRQGQVIEEDLSEPYLERQEMVVMAFSSLATIWGECSTVHSPTALFFLFFLFFFFFLVEISSRTLNPLSG